MCFYQPLRVNGRHYAAKALLTNTIIGSSEKERHLMVIGKGVDGERCGGPLRLGGEIPQFMRFVHQYQATVVGRGGV